MSDVYVKATLLMSEKKLKKKKTSTSTARPGVIKARLGVIKARPGVTNAVWNEALTFTSLSRQQLETSAKLELLLHHGNHGDAVGKVTVGPGNDVGEEEFSHWTDMLNARPAVAKWHELKPVTVTSHHHHRHHHQDMTHTNDSR